MTQKLLRKVVKRIDHLKVKKVVKPPHVWMIEEYEYCTIKKEMVWEIAGDSDGQYRIFGARSSARFWMRAEFAQDTHWKTGKIRRLRVSKYVRA